MRRKAIWPLFFIVPALIGGLFTAAVLLTPLPEPNNPEVTEILDATGERVVARLFTEDRVEIPVVRMPQTLLNAIVAVEDDRFYHHHGIDPVGILRAVVRNLQARKVVQGGSTLTQQLARNLTLGGYRLGQQRTLTRKIKEALITIQLEYRYSKEQILGMYWNTIYLGRGSYGLERAAQSYFGKSVQLMPEDQPLNLSLAECALLAALPQAPEYYSSDDAEARAALRARRDLILAKMAEQGYITTAEAEAARQQAVQLNPPRPMAETAPYFADYVALELKERLPHVAANLYQGGYRVITTLDLATQAAAEEAVDAGLKAIGTAGQERPLGNPIGLPPQVALTAVEPTTGYIRALVGGREPQVGRNRAMEPRQPGSTFKPFVYAAALTTRRYVATSTQIDAPREYPGRTADQPWRIRNWEGTSSNAPETMRTALKRSLNTVTAAWMDALKPQAVIDLAKAVGLEADYPNDLTIGLGTVSVSPLQVTTAYAALANGGYRVTPTAVLRVEDRQGNVVATQEPARTKALEPGVAFIVTDMLKEVLRPGGTGDRAAGWLAGRPAAAKSGTTDDSVDAWFAGYTPTLAAAIWVGYDDRRKTELLGGRDISPIWGRFVSRALAGQPRPDWSPPENVVGEEICRLTGLLPNASCPTHTEWYMQGTAPDEIDPTLHWERGVPPLPTEQPPGPIPAPTQGRPGDTEPAIRAPDAPEPSQERTPESPPRP